MTRPVGHRLSSGLAPMAPSAIAAQTGFRKAGRTHVRASTRSIAARRIIRVAELQASFVGATP
jgi:hypothetical protein